MQAIFGSGLMWVAILAPLAVVFFLSFRIHAMKPATAQASFWLYAALNGVAFSILFIAGIRKLRKNTTASGARMATLDRKAAPLLRNE